uniref:Major facilitator superfamily (MFS) profile domain-containing protein n=1 Tax=Araucaria cunninghamii TaxID=56994 RepID=A0A0D6R4E6_ARACU
MVMVIESEIWQPSPWFYALLVVSCGAAIYGRFHAIYKRSRTVPPNLESSFNSFINLPSPFLTFQRVFLAVYFLAAVTEGLQAVYGESLYQQYGVGREDMAMLFSSGYLVSLFLGTFLGVISDFVGRKKACIVFCILHIIGSLARLSGKYHSICVGTASIALASSLFSCTFEAWMTAEHDKLGFRQDWLSDTFWTMSFGAAASSLGSAALANALVNWKAPHGITFPSAAAAVVALVSAIMITKLWGEDMATSKVKTPRIVLAFTYMMADKKMLLLAWSQSCFDFAVTVFWFLWTPTIVADGREVNISMIYPCLMGSIMLGSVAVSWLLCGPYFLRPEMYLTYAFVTASFSLAIPAYDYQDIGVLVALFCLFNVCVGIISPLLARLRSAYVPIDIRAGMISLSRVPANVAIVFVLIKGGYYHNLENSTILTLCVLGLLSGAGCLHILHRWICLANDKLPMERP